MRLSVSTPAGTDLGKRIRAWVVGLSVAALLFTLPGGPFAWVSPGWPRYAILVLGPALVWVTLIAFWRYWRPDREGEIRFGRAFAGLVAGVFLAMGYAANERANHFECAQFEQAREDAGECVGDERVLVVGPDTGVVFMYVVAGAMAFWVAASSAPWTDTRLSGKSQEP